MWLSSARIKHTTGRTTDPVSPYDVPKIMKTVSCSHNGPWCLQRGWLCYASTHTWGRSMSEQKCDLDRKNCSRKIIRVPARSFTSFLKDNFLTVLPLIRGLQIRLTTILLTIICEAWIAGKTTCNNKGVLRKRQAFQDLFPVVIKCVFSYFQRRLGTD